MTPYSILSSNLFSGWLICMIVGSLLSPIFNYFWPRQTSIDVDLFIDPIRNHKIRKANRQNFESLK